MCHRKEINWNKKGTKLQETITTLAIKRGSKECLKILRSINEIDWNIKNDLEESPFSLCIELDDNETLQFLNKNEKLINPNIFHNQDLKKKAYNKTLYYIRTLMQESNNDTERFITQNIFEEFVFAIKGSFSPVIIQILILGLTTQDLTLLILNWKNNKD